LKTAVQRPKEHDGGAAGAATRRRVRFDIAGRVQGVGFRPFVCRLARELGIAGNVANRRGGVRIEAEGEAGRIEQFAARLRQAPRAARIETLSRCESTPVGAEGFEILESEPDDAAALFLPLDLALCGECRGELFDSRDRRFGYPMIGCNGCGPRFTIIESLPYDRAATTMRDFEMCPACAEECADDIDRRFHAQVNACAVCGPGCSWSGSDGAVRGGAALSAAVAALRRGGVIAVKGIGGFHLMADARSASAAARLRRIKRRDAKPFAVMYPDLRSLESDALLTATDREALASPHAPIVLVEGRGERGLADAVAPGSAIIGAMLPYAPLHALLIGSFEGPLIATSANVSDEPMMIGARAVARRFGSELDGILDHNRRIARAADDSIARVIDGAVTPLRIGRGTAPACLRIPPGWELEAVSGDILALGAHEKASIAVIRGDTVLLSQHLGDLESVESREAYAAAIEDFIGLLDVRPALVVCDAHPDYFSSRIARELAGRFACEVEPVQHHEAHLYAALLDAGLDPLPDTMALCWDGTGLGSDGTIWGGEALAISCDVPASPRRTGSLHPFGLVGSDACIREPWRVALALLREAGCAAEAIRWSADRSAFRPSPSAIRMLGDVMDRGVGSTACTSMGRLFDGVASMLGLRHRIQFSAQAAMELEAAAGEGEAHRCYPIPMDGAEGACRRFDWRPMIREIVADLHGGVGVEVIAAAFHESLAQMAAKTVEGRPGAAILLTGGCFQNRRLAESVAARLRVAGREVWMHRRVPPNDGGLAAGQALAGLLRMNARRTGRG
jgi:hydrogenase maturation protein HypF